jgi:hypothetical protein
MAAIVSGEGSNGRRVELTDQIALSRRKQGFESPRERQSFQTHSKKFFKRGVDFSNFSPIGRRPEQSFLSMLQAAKNKRGSAIAMSCEAVSASPTRFWHAGNCVGEPYAT